MSIVGLFTFVAKKLEADQVPSGLPRYTSFVALTIGAVGMGAVGHFTNATLLTSGAFVTWITLVAGLLYHAIANDGGVAFSVNAETWATAVVGVAISLLVYFADNPMAGFGGFVAAGISTFAMYFHVAGNAVTPVAIASQPTLAAPASH